MTASELVIAYLEDELTLDEVLDQVRDNPELALEVFFTAQAARAELPK